MRWEHWHMNIAWRSSGYWSSVVLLAYLLEASQTVWG
jgi:hypothetical protein